MLAAPVVALARDDLLHCLAVDIGNRDREAALGQRFGNAEPDAARPAGDERVSRLCDIHRAALPGALATVGVWRQQRRSCSLAHATAISFK
jgi:hypothetical protein